MNKDINDFKKQFYEIRNLGYVKAINENSSGIGLTFEKLLGKNIDNFPLPDYKNTLEIKTKLTYSKTPIHLFKLTPEGNSFFEIKRILEKYGYCQTTNKEYKVFNGQINSGKFKKIGYYYFSISTNYKDEKVELIVKDQSQKVIDSSVYWTFEKLENALIRKLKYLIIVYVWSTTKNKETYYKYYKYNIYKLTNFYNFLHLIDNGIISVTFSIDYYKSINRYGQIHDHGTSFDIRIDDLNNLYYKID